jgi:hypothetical protein
MFCISVPFLFGHVLGVLEIQQPTHAALGHLFVQPAGDTEAQLGFV